MAELRIDGLAHDGAGVGRLDDGRVVFVPAALPGDIVEVALTGAHARRLQGHLLRLITPSPERVTSRCDVHLCGGCPVREAAPALQLAAKHARLTATMRRIGGLDVAALLPPVIACGEPWGYRHRVRLHAAFFDRQWHLGYHARRSHELVPLSRCPVLWPEVEQLALALAVALAPVPEAAGLREVELAFSRRDGRGAARITVAATPLPLRQHPGWLASSGVAGVHVVGPAGSWRHGNLELRYDHQDAGSYDLRFEPGLFTQANPTVNDALVAHVMAAVAPHGCQPVVELHAGVGNFSLALARAGATVRAFESMPRAALLARRNSRAPGLHLEVHAEADTAAAPHLRADTVVLLDPPRGGARAACEMLAASPVRRVVYVSCDAATLARDAAVLAAAGLRPQALHAFDMFPQTPHVEVVCVFARD